MYDSLHNSAPHPILFKHRQSKRRLHEKQPVTCMFDGTIFFRRPLQYCSEIEKDLKPLFEFITAILNNHCKSCPCHEKMSSPTFCRCVYTVNVIAYILCPALIHLFLFNSQYLEKLKYFRKCYLMLFQITDVPKRVTSCDCGMTLV